MTARGIALHIDGIIGDYPAFRVAFVVLRGIRPPGDCGPGIEALAAETERRAAAMLSATAIAELEEIRQWRAAYRSFGIKKTSYRNACEALLRRIRRGEGLPRVAPLVDLYNALSVKYRIPAGADDLAALTPPLAFRYAAPGDGFRDLAGDPDSDDPPKPGEVVLADAAHVLCRRWNWRQDARSRIQPATTDATLVLQTLADDGAERLTQAAEELAKHARDDLGASCAWAIASADTPVVEL
ncbi:MAG: hypothetical protein IIC08_07480 [Proteobacteria bacterium]|nr:hypothetical protein [Pseudomonadota bacterium]